MDEEWLLHRAVGRRYSDSVSHAPKVQSMYLAWSEHSHWVEECPPKLTSTHNLGMWPYSEIVFLQMPSRHSEVMLD